MPVDASVAQNLGLIINGASIRYPVPVYTTTTILSHNALDQNRGSFKLDHALTSKDHSELRLRYIDLQDQRRGQNTGGGDGVFSAPASRKLAVRSSSLPTGRTPFRRPCLISSAQATCAMSQISPSLHRFWVFRPSLAPIP